MKRALYIVGFLLAAGVVATFFYATGHRDGRQTATKQVYLDMATAGLISARAAEAQPQLKEYAKAQFYYYSHFYSPHIYQDLGPVDEKLILGIDPFIRHADSPNDYYRKK